MIKWRNQNKRNVQCFCFLRVNNIKTNAINRSRTIEIIVIIAFFSCFSYGFPTLSKSGVMPIIMANASIFAIKLIIPHDNVSSIDLVNVWQMASSYDIIKMGMLVKPIRAHDTAIWVAFFSQHTASMKYKKAKRVDTFDIMLAFL